MTPNKLRKMGSKLGDGWQAKLARLMPCNSRTVRRWLSGEIQMRPMTWERVKQVVRENKN